MAVGLLLCCCGTEAVADRLLLCRCAAVAVADRLLLCDSGAVAMTDRLLLSIQGPKFTFEVGCPLDNHHFRSTPPR